MCNCVKTNLPDLTVEDRNHRAISDGFNQVEYIDNLNRIVADMAAERVRLMDRIKKLSQELHDLLWSN
jgi:hypothetical protein